MHVRSVGYIYTLWTSISEPVRLSTNHDNMTEILVATIYNTHTVAHD